MYNEGLRLQKEWCEEVAARLPESEATVRGRLFDYSAPSEENSLFNLIEEQLRCERIMEGNPHPFIKSGLKEFIDGTKKELDKIVLERLCFWQAHIDSKRGADSSLSAERVQATLQRKRQLQTMLQAAPLPQDADMRGPLFDNGEAGQSVSDIISNQLDREERQRWKGKPVLKSGLHEVIDGAKDEPDPLVFGRLCFLRRYFVEVCHKGWHEDPLLEQLLDGLADERQQREQQAKQKVQAVLQHLRQQGAAGLFPIEFKHYFPVLSAEQAHWFFSDDVPQPPSDARQTEATERNVVPFPTRAAANEPIETGFEKVMEKWNANAAIKAQQKEQLATRATADTRHDIVERIERASLDDASRSAPGPIVWSAEELQVSFSNIPHRHWLYGTHLIRGEITVLAAPGGAGKTALAMGMAVEIAAGISKLGEKLWESKDQKVLYTSGEEKSDELRRRVRAFCQEHNILEQDIARLLVVAGDDARVQSMVFLRTKQGAADFNEDGFNALRAALETLRPDLLVLDPLVVFCGGGDMNGTTMALVMQRLKALAIQFDCAVLLVHHTRKGKPNSEEPAAEAERISGTAAIVNLARRALMPVTMTEPETKTYSVLPSERLKYFKLLDVKSNLAPLSTEAPWYELADVQLGNAEPPTYPNGDRVQAVKRARLTREKAGSPLGLEQLTIRFELMKLIDRGIMIDNEKVPYSPNSTGNNKMRAILTDAMAAVERETPDREWLSRDLRATVERELEAIKQDGWAVVEKIKTGRFRRGCGLRPVWERTPWKDERANLQEQGGPTVRTEEEQQELEQSDMHELIDRISPK